MVLGFSLNPIGRENLLFIAVDGLNFMGYSFSWFFVEGPFQEFQYPCNGNFLHE